MNPFPENHPLRSAAATLLARESAPLCPTAPRFKGLLAGHTHPSYNVLAGLHLLNDDLDAAHQLVQVHEEDPTANYWHQLVHRREGDWGNTRYWVGKTGPHPFYATLGAQTARERVDLCERGARLGGEAEETAARLAWNEMVTLFLWCVAEKK